MRAGLRASPLAFAPKALGRGFRRAPRVLDLLMDRASILDQSEQLERHIALVAGDLSRQREIVVDLLREDRDASSAMDLLHEFEALYARLIADRAVVKRKLDYATR